MQGQNDGGSRQDGASVHEPVLRLKRFALVLTGDDARADLLLARLGEQVDLPRPGEVAPGALQFLQFRRLYDLFQGMERGKPASAGLLAPGNANEAIRKGLDPQIAAVMGSLPSQHRALLLLVYGEDYSYEAAARLLGISIEQLMTALARAWVKFCDGGNRSTQGDEPSAGAAAAAAAPAGAAAPRSRASARAPGGRGLMHDTA
jgi:hypothetical protein